MSRAAYILPLVLALVACTSRVPTAGVEVGGRGRYPAVAVAPLFADDIRVGPVASFRTAPTPAGWNTRDKAARIAAELLEPAGTKVTTIEATGLAATDPRQPGDGLRAAGRVPGGGVVLALRQNAIDSRGRQYSPALDFLSMGVVGLVVGAATHHETQYQPSFFLATGDAFESTRCAVGLDASLIDGTSGALLAEARNILGQEQMPGSFRPRSWAAMTNEERASAETYCIAALRRGISEAIAALNLIAR